MDICNGPMPTSGCGKSRDLLCKKLRLDLRQCQVVLYMGDDAAMINEGSSSKV
ncbi:hypothetical protein PIROE2DRAFT_14523 [Piromyces sp. E2]|nr:hypothetical protein PIROE2DRAFT_14523 [Piromyces sp. E2]|eukprot:OUM59857.1 hypothetical protein PIROE2DRAFT_14523 [Piromyces sp. E2]